MHVLLNFCSNPYYEPTIVVQDNSVAKALCTSGKSKLLFQVLVIIILNLALCIGLPNCHSVVMKTRSISTEGNISYLHGVYSGILTQ